MEKWKKVCFISSSGLGSVLLVLFVRGLKKFDVYVCGYLNLVKIRSRTAGKRRGGSSSICRGRFVVAQHIITALTTYLFKWLDLIFAYIVSKEESWRLYIACCLGPTIENLNIPTYYRRFQRQKSSYVTTLHFQISETCFQLCFAAADDAIEI